MLDFLEWIRDFIMIITTNFDDVRSIHDHEMNDIIKKMMADKKTIKFLKTFDLDFDSHKFVSDLTSFNTVTDFQIQVVIPLFEQIFRKTITEITHSGIKNIPIDKSFILISNHRSIILDSAIVNTTFNKNGMRMCNTVIGNNLLMNEIIINIFKLLKCFVIKRDLLPKEQVRFLKKFSQYISYTIQEKNECIWLAQSSGRSKDGNDKTNPAILKMLAMANNNSLKDHFCSLCIIPVSCSYEYEPCDTLKAREGLIKMRDSKYIKEKNEDLISIKTEICKPKGRAHISFGKPLETELDEISSIPNKKEIFLSLAEKIDNQILGNYKVFPNNYIAADLVTKSNRYENHYSNTAKEKFIKYLYNNMQTIEDNQTDIYNLLLNMYANPVFNQQKQ